MKIYLLVLMLTGCTAGTPPEDETPQSQEVPTMTDESLNRSVKSLDRTLKMMDKMISDLDKMNNNLDEIFRAVTDCKTAAECESLKEKYAQEYEENRLNEED